MDGPLDISIQVRKICDEAQLAVGFGDEEGGRYPISGEGNAFEETILESLVNYALGLFLEVDRDLSGREDAFRFHASFWNGESNGHFRAGHRAGAEDVAEDLRKLYLEGSEVALGRRRCRIGSETGSLLVERAGEILVDDAESLQIMPADENGVFEVGRDQAVNIG